ncbi:MAG TPA: uroporphyrinogen-III C-methyltransferase [Terriglobales bacterium]|nr:uroporphyrinogen-III C-methyltransferase [Terriglobales bacterium]
MVYLVGAGPGDPELATLKARRVLASADAVFYDALANPALLDWAPASAERCFVGKRAGAHAATQADIHRWLIARARRGGTIVRLKGGDPLVFARAGEEMAVLRRAGVNFEIIPGISAASAAAAAAAVPLTDRHLASGVRFLSAPALVRAPPTPTSETLAVYMGAGRISAIAQSLLDAGWRRATPATAVANASLSGQRIASATLGGLLRRPPRLPAPVLILVGNAVRPRKLRLAAKPQKAVKTGLILMAHGSPLKAWQHDINALARTLAQPGEFSRAAFLVPVTPSLEAVVAEANRAGVRRAVVVPYFLAPGLHVSRDIPALVAAAQRRYPSCRLLLADCLAGHPALRTAVLSRAAAALAVQAMPPLHKRM